MVGYTEDELMTDNQKLLAGCVSGVITRFITQPMDVLKVKAQLMQQLTTDKKKWFGITRKIFKEEGILAFWHGHNLGQAYSILAVSSQFYVYEIATKYVEKAPLSDQHKQILVFFSGVFAGCCSTSLSLPLEVIRVRQILVKQKYKGVFNGAKEVYHTGGFFAFYEGLSASLLQMGPQVGISFCVFRYTQPLLLSYFGGCKDGKCDVVGADKSPSGNAHDVQNVLMSSSIAALIAGFVSKTVTYPMDLVKRRLQIATHLDDGKHFVPKSSQKLIRCRKLIECLLKTIRLEGFFGLYRGWNVTILKAQLTSITSFTTYELVCYAIREMSFVK